MTGRGAGMMERGAGMMEREWGGDRGAHDQRCWRVASHPPPSLPPERGEG